MPRRGINNNVAGLSRCLWQSRISYCRALFIESCLFRGTLLLFCKSYCDAISDPILLHSADAYHRARKWRKDEQTRFKGLDLLTDRSVYVSSEPLDDSAPYPFVCSAKSTLLLLLCLGPLTTHSLHIYSHCQLTHFSRLLVNTSGVNRLPFRLGTGHAFIVFSGVVEPSSMFWTIPLRSKNRKYLVISCFFVTFLTGSLCYIIKECFVFFYFNHFSLIIFYNSVWLGFELFGF